MTLFGTKVKSGESYDGNFILENAEIYQTHYTPNVFGIYLLYRVLQDMPEIQHIVSGDLGHRLVADDIDEVAHHALEDLIVGDVAPRAALATPLNTGVLATAAALRQVRKMGEGSATDLLIVGLSG